MTSGDFSNHEKDLSSSKSLKFLKETNLPSSSELEGLISKKVIDFLECDLTELKDLNENQQKEFGYKKFDEYYLVFERSLLSNTSQNETNTHNLQIESFKLALKTLTDTLNKSVEKISENVWEEIKIDFNSSVVSTTN